MSRQKENFHGSINGQILMDSRGLIVKKFSNLRDPLRFKRELHFYEYCNKTYNTSVPTIFEVNADDQYIKMENINGEIPKEDDRNYITSFVKFLAMLNHPKNELALQNYTLNGKESCFSTRDIFENCMNRLIRITEGNCDLSLRNLASKYVAYLEKNLVGKEFNTTCLNPSDNGRHNCIVSEYKYYFIDFEYSGIDTFEKVYYDLVLHPANNIKKENYNYLIDYFNNNIAACDLKFDLELYTAFCIWWILRLTDSITEKVISERIDRGNILSTEVDNYYADRMRNIQIFVEKIKNV